MELMPDDIRQRLLANGAAEAETDHVPVVKFFNPTGAATWLITEMMSDEPDILFGLSLSETMSGSIDGAGLREPVSMRSAQPAR